MFDGNLLYTISQLGYSMLSYFSWIFDLFTQPIQLLGNTPIITIGFSSAMSLFFIRPIFNLLFPSGSLPSDQ